MNEPAPLIVTRLAFSLGRNDETPNIELANQIAAKHDHEAVNSLVEVLDDPNQSIRSDALKVLYEIGKVEPSLIAGHGDRFVKLLSDRHNRMKWGGMEALAAVAQVDPLSLLPHLETIELATQSGSVITRDWGIRVLASMALADTNSRQSIADFLFSMLEKCKPSEFPRHAESMLVLMSTDQAFAERFQRLAKSRIPELTKPQAKRTARVLSSLEAPRS